MPQNMRLAGCNDMQREIVCIVCPQSCLLTTDDGDKIHVTGNNCDKGIAFAEKEKYDPERILTTTVKLTNGDLLPVRSNAPVKKHEMRSLVASLKSIEIKPPVVAGQIIVSNKGENSVNIIATDHVE